MLKQNKKAIILFGGLGKLGIYFVQNSTFDYSRYDLLILDKVNKNEINCLPENVIYYKCDITDESSLKSSLNNLSHSYKDLTLVNFIGYDFPVGESEKIISRKTPLEVSEKELGKCLLLNISTSHNIAKCALKTGKSFHLIFISSVYANKPTNPELYSEKELLDKKYKPYIYGSSKAAIEKLANDLSVFLPKYESRINVISLGGVDLGISPEFVEKYSKWSPQGSMIKPSSVTKLLNWLILDSPLELNGCVIKLDSGLSNL